MDFDQLFAGFKNIKVAVIGDVMLDTYWWGKVERISPEAPVPVVAVSKKEQRIGGAGNVALNLQSLGANVSVLSVLGKDDDGDQLTKLFNSNNIIVSQVFGKPGNGLHLIVLADFDGTDLFYLQLIVVVNFVDESDFCKIITFLFHLFVFNI